MAEAIKKQKAPAKPKKAATKKSTVVEMTQEATPSREQIEQLARKFWADRGWQDGFAEQDWLRAEQELRGKAS